MYQSIVKKLGPVSFPAYAGERHYMVPFRKSAGLPKRLAHWQPAVDAMLVDIDSDEQIYFMADQSRVASGETQRRPGVHLDGYWLPTLGRHGGHRAVSGKWDGGGGDWRGQSGERGWDKVDFSAPEAIILASDVSACRTYVGGYSGKIGDGGDASGVCLDSLQPMLLEANRAYAGNVSMLHESLPVASDCLRTLIRLNVPGWSP